MNPEPRRRWSRILALVSTLVLTILLIHFQSKFKNLGSYGYPGIFFISILSNATVIIPIPGVVITSALGAVFNPFWVAVAAGSGAAIGELSGYLAGYSGQGILEKLKVHDRLNEIIRKYGGIAIMVLAFIPNPAFDLAGISAGALKMPPATFLFWCWIGKILKMIMFAFGGSFIIKIFH